MLNGVNVEQIKQYNQQLREQKERASTIDAEIKFNSSELERLCNELTAQLGIQVTPDNIEQIYQEKVQEINNTLETGQEILRRVAEEEKQASQPAQTQTVQTVQPMQQVQNQQSVQTAQQTQPVSSQTGNGFIQQIQTVYQPKPDEDLPRDLI